MVKGMVTQYVDVKVDSKSVILDYVLCVNATSGIDPNYVTNSGMPQNSNTSVSEHSKCLLLAIRASYEQHMRQGLMKPTPHLDTCQRLPRGVIGNLAP
jgi:hypothetical protein